MWVRLLPYLATAAAVVFFLVAVNNRAYDNGKAAAEKTCSDTTVPNALAEQLVNFNKITKATKEENDALLRDTKRLRATYERLRATKPVAACVPLTLPSRGDVRPDGTPVPSGGLGVNTEWLDAAFFDAANDIARGESCQRQLKNIYLLNGVTP